MKIFSPTITGSLGVLGNTILDGNLNVTGGITGSTVYSPSGSFLNLTATSASFGFVEAVTGSAVYIGESFVVVNASSPAVRYAGIAVFDSGSSPIASASLEWDSLTDTWITMEETGNTSVIITGPTGSRGSETYTTVNKLQKGLGLNYIGDSSITDNGTNVTFTTPIAGTSISASTGFLGNLTGTASFATSASFAPQTPAFPFSGSAVITGSLVIENPTDTTVFSLTQGGISAYALSHGGGFDTLTTIPINAVHAFTGGGNNRYQFEVPLRVSSSLTVTGSISLTDRLAFANTATGGVIISNYTGSMTSQKYVLIGNNINEVSETGIDNVQIGYFSRIVNGARNNIVVIGASASAAQDSVCIGSSAESNVAEGVVIGKSARATQNGAVVIGKSADGQGTNSIAIGNAVTTAATNEINIGNKFRFNSGSNGIINLVDDVSVSGSLVVTGPINAPSFTGSLFGTASFATSASFATTASFALNAAPTFPFTGNAQINGNLSVTGSYLRLSGSFSGSVIDNITDTFTASPPVEHVVSLTQAEYNTISGSADPNTLYYITDAASFATSASFATTAATASFVAGVALLASNNTFIANNSFQGQVIGAVEALAIAGTTASLDCSLGNFYTLQLVSGSNTFINPSNITAGQTINIRVNTTGSATVSFPSTVLQVSGSAYVPTTTTGVDVVTFISFDASSLLLSNVKNLV